MSKRSGLSRLEDLKRRFVDIGRYRYILHKIDMEDWRDRICPVCKFGFAGPPQYFMSIYAIHNDCALTPAYEAWIQETFYSDEDDDEPQ